MNMDSLLSVESIKAVRYISLKKDLLRRVLLRIQLRSLKCDKKWICGVNYEASNPIYNKYTKMGFEPYLSEIEQQGRIKGVAGCWIAHSHALEDITDRDGISIILEDDFMCRPGFFKKAMEMINQLGQEFDVIVFDPLGTGPLPEHLISKDIYTNNGGSWPFYVGSHCLFINNRNIPKILDDKLNTQIKDFDGFLFMNTKLKVYLFYSHMCSSNYYGSSITNDYTSSWINHINGILKLLKYRQPNSEFTPKLYIQEIMDKPGQ
jgi:hypothetical protein